MKISSWEMSIVELQLFGNCWDRRGPKHPEDPFNALLNILDMGTISINNSEYILNLCNFETLIFEN